MEYTTTTTCKDCFWWTEGPLFCKNCPNQPKTGVVGNTAREKDSPRFRGWSISFHQSIIAPLSAGVFGLEALKADSGAGTFSLSARHD
jgi:hypothetical protein